MILRAFEKKDRDALRQIACNTAFLGLPYQLFIDDKEILADALTVYFTDYEPESCFVAEENEKIVGYLIGTKNAQKMNGIFKQKIFPQLFKKTLLSGIIFQKNTFIFLRNLLQSLVKGEFLAPDFSLKYPALLHINIAQDFRGQKIGERLINHYLNFLKENNISAVHLGTMSENAKEFFQKCGFMILFQGHRSYLKNHLKKNASYYILGRAV
ncbi:MAG TPA: GNAT family N-acetyltransferase [Candidatus Omnitrophota bacterium]|nr:GNAT family N-acetyltransferase [Candidatus Omnitrophota bacterium]